jgi:hypothetical protein
VNDELDLQPTCVDERHSEVSNQSAPDLASPSTSAVRGSGSPTFAPANHVSRFAPTISRSLLCLAVLVAILAPRADRAQSQSPSIQIIAGIAVGQEAVTCNGANNVCTGTSTLGYIYNGCRGLPYSLPASPIQICNTGYGGDGGPATIGMLNFPVAVAADSNGNVYIADAGNFVVRKVDPLGSISTYACVDPSTGAISYSGCQLPPANSSFWLQEAGWPPQGYYPSALAVNGQGQVQIGVSVPAGLGLGSEPSTVLGLASDPSGNTYELEMGSGGEFDVQIFKNGNLFETLPVGLYTGLAADSAGNLYTIESGGTILSINSSGASSVFVTNAQIGMPQATSAPPGNPLAVDSSGNLYVLTSCSQYGCATVSEYNPTSGEWTTLAGTGTDGFNNGNGTYPNVPGFTDLSNPTGGIDGPMPATSTDLNNAASIAIGPDGALYIADTGNNVVRRVGGHSGPGCSECGPTTLAITDQISRPLPSSWAFNPTLHKLYMITSTTPGVVTAFDTTNDTVIDNIQFGLTSTINQIAVDSTNNLVYVPDTTNNAVYVINSSTDQQVAGSPVTLPAAPGNIAVLPDAGNSRAYITIPNGGYSNQPSVPGVAVVAGPSAANASATYVTGIGNYSSGLALDGASAIIADPQRDKVYVRFTGFIGSEFWYSLAVINASSTGNNTISTTQNLSVQVGFSPIYPDSMAIDESTGNVLIGDDFDPYVRLFDYATQTVSGFFPGAGIYNYHVAADTINGIFYTWDGYGNVAYLIPNQASNVITSATPSNSNESYVAVDSLTEQAYVMNCNTANGGTLGTLTLWDGSTDKALATLPLGIPSTATSEGCGSMFVDSSNSNPKAHRAWLSFYYGTQAGTAGQVDVINGPAPAQRPSISVLFGNTLGIGTNPAPFQDVGVGQAATEEIRIKNNGPGPLNSVTLDLEDAQDPGSLEIASNGCAGLSSTQPIPVGGECSFLLTFTPTKVENFSGAVLILDNAGDTPQSVPINGSGVPAIAPLTIAPNFLPPGVAGQFYGQVFSASGLAGSPNWSITGTLPPDLAFNGPLGLSGTLAAQDVGTWNFTITVQDTANGNTASQLYSLIITANAAGQTTVNIFGNGSSGVVSLGSIQQGEPSAAQQINLTDSYQSNTSMQIYSVTLTGPNAADFAVTNNCGVQTQQLYSSGQGCTITATFTPTAAVGTNEVAEVVVGTNAPLAPIFLTGTSAAPLGAPASLPVAVSVDNGNPPKLAAAANTIGCYPPECGGSGSSNLGAISSGGKFIGFSFAASNLPGPASSSSQGQSQNAYLRNTCIGTTAGCEESTEYISYGPTTGPAANGGQPCNVPPFAGGSASNNVTGIDSTGQYVLFESNGCAFSGPSPQNANQIFLRDAINGNTTLVSVDPTNSIVLSNGASNSSMSNDGRFFAFASTSTNADANFTNPNGGSEVYWRGCTARPSTTCTPSTVIVSQDNVNDATNDSSGQPSISAGGRFVAFTSTATQLTELTAPLQNNVAGTTNVFLWDSCAGTAVSACTPHTTLISQDASGNAVGGASPSVSADGRFVVFTSKAPTLIPTADQAQYDGYSQEVYLADTCLSNGTSVAGCQSQPPILISQLNGVPGNTDSTGPTISADGTAVLFSSGSPKLTTLTLFNQSPVYKYANCLASATSTNCVASLQIISVDANGNPIENVFSSGVLDPTGQYFIFGQQTTAGGYTPSTEIYLGSTSPAAPFATFSALFSWSGTSSSINFGTFPVAEPGFLGSIGGSPFGGGGTAVAQNEALFTITNTGSVPFTLPPLTLTSTQTGQSAPFALQYFSCLGQTYTQEPTGQVLAPGQDCQSIIYFNATAPGTYNAVLSANGVPGNSLPVTGTVTGPFLGIVAPAGAGIGRNFSYTVTVYNPTGLTVNNLSVNIPVPAGLTLVSVTPQNFTCNTTIACTGSLPPAGPDSQIENCDSTGLNCSITGQPGPPSTENIVVTLTPTTGGSVTESAVLSLANAYPGFNLPSQSASGTTSVATSTIPPTTTLSFSSGTIPVSTSNSSLSGLANPRLTIANPNQFPLTNAGFTITLPAGLAVYSVDIGSESGFCGSGSVTATTSLITVSGLTLPASGQCQMFLPRMVGLTVGQYVVSTSPVSYDGGSAAPSSATLSVITIQPAVSASFSPSTIFVGGQSTLTLTITNPNASFALSGVSLVDIPPAGLPASSSFQSVSGCGTNPSNLSGVLVLSGASIAPGGSCSFSYAVTGTSIGTYTNTTQPVSADQGTGGTASATLTVNGVSITTSSLPTGQFGVAYSQTLTATGGTPPYTWAVTSGTLPIGLSLNSTTGVLSGTPKLGAQAAFTVTVTDSLGLTATRSFSLTILAPQIVTSLESIALSNGNYVATLLVRNNGNLTATGTQLVSASMVALNTTTLKPQTTATITSLPATLGDIAPGSSASISISFPHSAGGDGLSAVIEFGLTFSGGNAGGSTRTTLP